MAGSYRILGVGIATVDIVNSVQNYPAEDDEVRALAQSIRRGGNTTNTLVLLSRLGHQCSWAGTIADDLYAQLIRDDLRTHAVSCDLAVVESHSASPLSCITVSLDTGSRCIVHYRDLREYSATDFAAVDPDIFDWIHFEGRHVEETLQMLDRLRQRAGSVSISIEIEKPRAGIEKLFGYADVLLFSKGFVLNKGYTDAQTFLGDMHQRYPAIEHYCAWGSDGAYAIDNEGGIHHAVATALEVVDSVGAGDTFNAGIIDARLKRLALPQSLQQACELAARKCSHAGIVQ